MTPAMMRRAQELAEQGTPFVTATVVRAQRPTSVQAGDVALVLADGTIEGFVGGVCTEHSVRSYALQTLQRGEAMLLRILPFDADASAAGEADDGAVTVQNPCLSGGAIELFLEPVTRTARVLVIGETPIARALVTLGEGLELDVVPVEAAALDLRAGDLALVVATHGRDELLALRRGLEAELPYVGLIASPRRGSGVLAELRGDGVPDDQLARVDVPAGLRIGARTPGEIALSILAQIVAVRRGEPVPAELASVTPPPAVLKAEAFAIDPICGMQVVVADSTPSLRDGDETVYFCCEGCRARYQAEHAGAA
jgi:xanthine dehydrogenase accessory factor